MTLFITLESNVKLNFFGMKIIFKTVLKCRHILSGRRTRFWRTLPNVLYSNEERGEARHVTPEACGNVTRRFDTRKRHA